MLVHKDVHSDEGGGQHELTRTSYGTWTAGEKQRVENIKKPRGPFIGLQATFQLWTQFIGVY